MNIFDNIQIRKPKSSKFDLSHERKFSLNMGDLTPFFHQEVVPGDRFRVSSEILLRLAPMIAPVMHRIDVFTHFFFVPNRLVWTEWEDFITGGEDGLAAPVFPQVKLGDVTKVNFDVGKLPDYFGIPIVDQGTPFSFNTWLNALPFRAYQLIYNEYYRDQNLTPAVDFSKGSGQLGDAETLLITEMKKRAWEKDYFTSSLPWAQRGETAQIPSVPEFQGRLYDYQNDRLYTPAQATDLQSNSAGGLVATDGTQLGMDDGSVIDVNDLRKAVRLQEWLEKSARGGARYIEQIFSHFGVRSSNKLLQRPQFLGGGKNPVVISENLSTYGNSTTETPQANMAGHGISVGRNNSFKYYAEEHGQIIGIMSILPKTTYQQGIDRFFHKFDKFDYYWPEFAHLGEQEVKNKELYYDFTAETNVGDQTFGYQQRYAEYKYKASSVHGQFRDQLAYWHMGRIFDSQPNLNTSFIESDPTKRIFAVTDPEAETLYCQMYNKVDAIRPMPYFGTPTL